MIGPMIRGERQKVIPHDAIWWHEVFYDVISQLIVPIFSESP